MTGHEWIVAFAEELGIDPPDHDTIDELLALAATAAHTSERFAAPIACYLVAMGGVSVEEGRRAAATLQLPRIGRPR